MCREKKSLVPGVLWSEAPCPALEIESTTPVIHHPLALTLLLTAMYFMIMAPPGSSLPKLKTWTYLWLFSFLPSLPLNCKSYWFYIHNADPNPFSWTIAKSPLSGVPASNLTPISTLCTHCEINLPKAKLRSCPPLVKTCKNNLLTTKWSLNFLAWHWGLPSSFLNLLCLIL